MPEVNKLSKEYEKGRIAINEFRDSIEGSESRLKLFHLDLEEWIDEFSIQMTDQEAFEEKLKKAKQEYFLGAKDIREQENQ